MFVLGQTPVTHTATRKKKYIHDAHSIYYIVLYAVQCLMIYTLPRKHQICLNSFKNKKYVEGNLQGIPTNTQSLIVNVVAVHLTIYQFIG